MLENKNIIITFWNKFIATSCNNLLSLFNRLTNKVSYKKLWISFEYQALSLIDTSFIQHYISLGFKNNTELRSWALMEKA